MKLTRPSPLATIFMSVLAIASAQDPLPGFAVASIKAPGPRDRAIDLRNYPGGRVFISLYTFAQLMGEALGVQRFQVVGAPEWIDSERFMIEAKPPESSELSAFKPPNDQAPLVPEQRQMLLALLMDRFHLRFHRESKEAVVYLLTKGSNTPKFDPPSRPGERMFLAGLLGGGNGAVEGGNATMEFIASKLSRSMGSPVLDNTGLTGPFDFTLEHVYGPEDHDDLVTIARRTVSALGLKLEKSRGPVEMIVVDHLEKPSDN